MTVASSRGSGELEYLEIEGRARDRLLCPVRNWSASGAGERRICGMAVAAETEPASVFAVAKTEPSDRARRTEGRFAG